MTIPDTMTAAVLTGHGDFDKLTVRHDWPVPAPGPGEVLVRVAACGMNNTDINTRLGWYADDGDDSGGWGGAIAFPRIQGADVCGRVVAVGPDVAGDWRGARVIGDPWLRDWADPRDLAQAQYLGSERDGGFAQYVALPVRNVGRVDGDWSDAELATLPCAYTTAENMLSRAGVAAGETVLVTGASGGVGSALVQLARRRGATVIALTSPGKAENVAALGATAVIRRGVDDWRDVTRAATGRDTVNVAADIVGEPVFDQLLAVLDRGGRYVTAGAIGGKRAGLDLSHLYLNDWTLIGATVTTPDIFPNLVSYVERGEIRPLLAATYPLTDIHQAQRDFLAKTFVGKLVLVP